MRTKTNLTKGTDQRCHNQILNGFFLFQKINTSMIDARLKWWWCNLLILWLSFICRSLANARRSTIPPSPPLPGVNTEDEPRKSPAEPVLRSKSTKTESMELRWWWWWLLLCLDNEWWWWGDEVGEVIGEVSEEGGPEAAPDPEPYKPCNEIEMSNEIWERGQ